MVYAAHTPAPPLAELVEYFWALSDVPPHARERILPSGTLELVVNLNEDEFRIYDRLHPERFRRLSGAIVSGAYGGYFVIDTLEHASVIGVHFKPGGAPAVLGIPAGALADAHADLQTLWGLGAVELRGRLCAATASERVHILEKALVDRLSRRLKRHGAVRFALEHLGLDGASVSSVAKSVQLSHRRLIELFTGEVGMTPKLFGRVRAVAFYTQNLGFGLEQSTGQVFATISRGSLRLLLSGPGSSGSRPLPDGRRQEPGGWNRIVLYVGDRASHIQALKTAGARFRNEVEVGPGGSQIQIEDPDGNPIELHEAPAVK